MSSRNDETSGMIFVLAIVVAVAYVIVLAVFMIAAFATFVLTILCFFAWKRPIGSGNFIITPDEAHAFVGRGLVGAFMLPAFFAFLDVFFDADVNWNYILHMAAVGYMIGSLGIEILMAQEEAASPVVNVPRQQVLPPSPPVKAIDVSNPRRSKKPSAPHPSFEYASWDDEEEAWR